MSKNKFYPFIVVAGLMSLINTEDIHSAEKYNSITVNSECTGEAPNESLLTDEAIATTYNADPKQTNGNPFITASGYRIKKTDILGQRVMAMERTMMKRHGIKYGDKVRIEGVSKELDGIWRVEDTMNKRFAGKKKIDLLIPKSMKGGLWKKVKVYKIHN